MKIWIIIPDEPTVPEDRAYTIGYLQSCFDRVMVTRAGREDATCADPPEKPDVILNLLSSRNPAYLRHIDEKANAWSVPVSPPSTGAYKTEDKRTYLTDFADVSPPTKVVGNMSELEDAVQAFGGDVVIKDPLGIRGHGVERLTGPQDFAIAEALLQSTICNTGQIIVQPFFSGFLKGDKRVILQRRPDNAFDIVAYIARIPPPDGWKSNLSAGATCVSTELSPAERAFVLGLAPRTGIDIICFDIAEHDGKLWYVEHNQGNGGIIDFDFQRGVAGIRHCAAFLMHIAEHGRPGPAAG